ncbi:putative methyltransferase type 11 [gamma proteobacterium NOR5-3]|nr:putative methyltransferase type 11 [gamma proteobacterium NOR5-3]
MNEFIRQPVASLLRTLRLLDAADRVLLARDQQRNAKLNRQFKIDNPEFALPPDLLAFEAYNTTSAEHYQKIGFDVASAIGDSINSYVNQQNGLHIMEWGCGPARVIRHLKPLIRSSDSIIIGTDYNRDTIDWCQSAIPDLKFILNEAMPPISYADSSFDAIYAVSVFTHLSEDAQNAWIQEIRRLLKPGGIFIFTTHGKSRLHKLIGPQRAAFEAGQLVTKGHYRVGKKHYLAYHPTDYVRNQMMKGFDVLEFQADDARNKIGQDKWVVRVLNS